MAHCWVRWYGYDEHGLLAEGPAACSPLQPPPSQRSYPRPPRGPAACCRHTAHGRWAFFWCGRSLISGSCRQNECGCHHTRGGGCWLNSSLYLAVSVSRRFGSRQIQSRNASLMACCFCWARCGFLLVEDAPFCCRPPPRWCRIPAHPSDSRYPSRIL